jgi:hypothetical protein
MVRINPPKLQSSIRSLIWDEILIQSISTPSSFAMAGRMSFPTFNTHFANFRYSLELAAMTRMLIQRRRIVTCCQRCDQSNKTLTMSLHLPLGTTSKICQKSPPRTMVFPPKIFLVTYASSNCIKSRRV